MNGDLLNKSFISFNITEENNDIKVEPMKIDIPDENVLFLIGKDLKYIWDLDIKNFNFIIFENDIENINDNEFEYFWNKFFIPWLNKLEDYIDFDIDKLRYNLSNVYEKKFLIKKIVHFIMMFFPYYIFKEILNNHNIEEKTQVQNLLKYYKDDPIYLRKELDTEFNKIEDKSKNFLSSLEHLLQFAKKGKLENSIDLLGKQIQKQDNYLKLFKSFIDQTDIDKIINLLETYIENDFENLI